MTVFSKPLSTIQRVHIRCFAQAHRTRSQRWLATLVSVLAASVLVVAPAAAETVTLDQLIQESLTKNAGVNRVQQEYAERGASAIDARTLDNPEISIDATRGRGVSGTGAEVELVQPFKLSQITGARVRYADALMDAATIEQRYEILKVINETTALYAQAWLLTERKRLYEKYAAEAGRAKNLVDLSTRQGQTSPAAGYLFASDAAKLRTDAAAVGAEMRRTRSELSKLTGRDLLSATLEKPAFSRVPNDVDRLVAFAERRANLRNLLKARVEAAENRLRVAEEDAILPEIGPRVVYSQSPDGAEESYGVGFVLRIPLWNQNDAEHKRAGAELQRFRSDSGLLSGVPLRESLSQLMHSAVTLTERADTYFTTVLPGYRKSYELSSAMFRQGQIDALALWQVREKLLASESEALEAVALALNARGALELELGGKLEEIQ